MTLCAETSYVATNLGSFAGGHAVAEALNNAGQVAGHSAVSATHEHAFLYSNGALIDLGTGPGNDYSVAYGISETGEVAVISSKYDEFGQDQSYLYSNGVLTNIGTLGGATYAYGMGPFGQIVGKSYLIGGSAHPFLYSGGMMTDLGFAGDAVDINDSGQVAGFSYTVGNAFRAFLYSEGIMLNLGSLGGNSAAFGLNNLGRTSG